MIDSRLTRQMSHNHTYEQARQTRPHSGGVVSTQKSVTLCGSRVLANLCSIFTVSGSGSGLYSGGLTLEHSTEV